MTFSDAGLERRYRGHLASEALKGTDTGYSVFWLSIYGICVCRFWGSIRREGVPVAMCTNIAWTIFDVALRLRMSRPRLLRWRNTLVIVGRVLHFLETAFASNATAEAFPMAWEKGSTLSAAMAMYYFCLAAGFVNIVMSMWTQYLTFKLHVCLHAPATAFLLLTSGMTACAHVSGQAHSGMSGLVDQLDAAAKSVLRVMYMSASDGMLEWPITHPCLQMSTFVLVFLGLGVGSYVVWLSDRQCRSRFLKKSHRADALGEPVPSLRGCAVGEHVVLMMILFAVMWETSLRFGDSVWGAGEVVGSWMRAMQLLYHPMHGDPR